MFKSNMCCTSIDGETKIEFLHKYRYFHVQNLGSADIKLSPYSGIDSMDEGYVTCKANNAVTLPTTDRANTIYISGSGDVNIIASDSATNPYRVAGKGGGITPQPPTPENKFELLGDGSFFSASSIDISNKTWKNLAAGNNITWETDSVTVDGDIVHFTKNDYGVIETDFPSTIYCVFKKASTSETGDIPVICGWYSNSTSSSEFGISLNTHTPVLLGNSNNVNCSADSANNFYAICVTRETRGELYVNGVYLGRTSGTITPGSNYKNSYFINNISRDEDGSAPSLYKRADIDFKFIAFDSVYHPIDTIKQNLKYLIDYIT